MLAAYGGGKWALDMIDRWSGTNPQGKAKLESDNALEVYSAFFDQESVIEASCRDYEAGATSDVDAESAAVEQGRSIDVPLLLIYSQGFLPKRAVKPVPEVWGPPWSKSQDLVTDYPIGDGIGHFVPEEAPELSAEALLKWLPTLQSRA